MKRIKALANFLEIKKSNITEGYDEFTFETEENGEYMVLTDEEADEKAAAYIEQSLWAFSTGFLASETGIDEEVFKAIQANERCESNNDAIESIVNSTCGIDDFVESAISADGRGHFINSYDGEESQEGEYFIYRVN
jgi:hypothetical protein